MLNIFNRKSHLSAAEQYLKSEGVKYKKKRDGAIRVPGSLRVAGANLTRLPDLSSVIVEGDFHCDNSQLASLAGAPQAVGGNFWCHNNCLTTLAGAPRFVCGDFTCGNNRLTSLQHAPQFVGGYFACHDNQLTSLKYMSASFGSEISCTHNQLTSLEYVPQICGKIVSDFGTFPSGKDIPETLRLSPETKALLEQERLQEEAARKVEADAAINNAVVLQDNIPVKGPLKFRNRAHE